VRTVLGAVIGERHLATGGGRPKRVTVSLGMPRLPRGEQDWECPFRITGAGMRVPKSIPSYGDERLTKRLETLIDRELERNLTRLRRRHQRKQA
jgi:hypothetical protein